MGSGRKCAMARRLRVEPYDPNAVDGDGDGIVQENTAWERPVGTRLIDEFGNEVRLGLMSMQRPARMRVVDRDGNDVRYVPTYQVTPKREITETPLGSIGAPSLVETGVTSVPTLADRGLRTIGETMDDVDAIVNPQTVVGEDAPELPTPRPAMLTKLAGSEPARLSLMYSSLHSGIPYMDRLTSSEEGIRILQQSWDDSLSGYFQYNSKATITLEEFLELSYSLYETGRIRPVRRDDGTEARPEEIEEAIHLTLSFAIERVRNGAELMKDSVASQIASRMITEDLSPRSVDYILSLLLYDLPSFSQHRGLGGSLQKLNGMSYTLNDPQRAGIPVDHLFSDSIMSPQNLKDYLSWGLGGERPLWLDSPDLIPEVRLIFSLPPIFYLREDSTSLEYPIVMPGSLVDITEFDTPEVSEAKRQARDVVNSIQSRFDVSHFQEFSVFGRFYSARRNEAAEEASRDVYLRIFRSLAEDETSDWDVIPIQEVLWPSGKSNRELNTQEQRLMIFAASSLCDDKRLQVIIDAVGWDFTKQDGWDRFVREVRRKQSKSTTTQLATMPVEDKLILIDRLTLDSYKTSEGQLIDSSSVDLSSDEYSSTIDYMVDMARLVSVVDQTSEEYEDLKQYVSSPRPGAGASLSEKDAWVQGLYERYMKCSKQSTENTPALYDLRVLLEGLGEYRPDLLSPEHISLLGDEPLYDVYKHIAANYVSSWAISSNGDVPLSHAIQQEAQEMFGLEEDEIVTLDDIFQERPERGGISKQDLVIQIGEVQQEQRDLIRAFIRAQYENTQEYYRSRGITTVPVARAMNLDPENPFVKALLEKSKVWDVLSENDRDFEIPPSIEVSALLRPLSSFASSIPPTRGFSDESVTYRKQGDPYGVVIVSQVPVHQILGSPYTGNGCLNEYELVVIGRMINTRMFLSYTVHDASLFDFSIGRRGAKIGAYD